MHFLSALAIVFTAFKCTAAVDPGRNALGIGFSDILEAAIHKDCTQPRPDAEPG